MSSVSAHWQVVSSPTTLYGGVVVAVTTIAVSLLIFRRLWKPQNKSLGSEEVASIVLFQGSSNFRICETNATLILNGNGQFTKIQRNLICDYIADLHIPLRDSNDNLKKLVLTWSITTLPRANVAFNGYQNKNNGTCFKGTTVAVLREMADCVTGSSECMMYILSGHAGIEKSTVAYTIASRAADLNLLGAFFCFSRDEADSNNAKRFFTTIAYQLCLYNETFAKAIGDVLETESGYAATTEDPQNQLHSLILIPLRTIVQSRSRPTLIIVDALDECDEEDALTVLTGLSQLAQYSPSFKVILITRPQPYLDRFLNSQDDHKFFHLQDIESKVVEGDIRLYLNHCLSLDQVQVHFPKRQWCASAEEIDSLVRAAGRLFIIALTAVRYILDKTTSDPAAQVQKLLCAFAQDRAPFKDLDHFYTVILQNIVPANCDDNIVSCYRSVVGAIIFVQRPLPVSTLAHLVGIDVEEIRAVLDKLRFVILLGDDDVPRIYHKSFSESLTNQARCKDPRLQIDPRICHTQIATRCFEIMDKQLKHNILGLGDPARFMSNEDGLKEDGITNEQLEEKIPQQLRYACLYWVNHFKAANTEDTDLMNGLEIFLVKHMLHWFEVLSLVGKLDSVHLAIVVLKSMKLSSELHQLLSDVIRFIGKFYEIIKRSALHTYYSALSFTPTDSVLYRQYSKDAVHNICVIEDGPERWDPIVADLRHGQGSDVVKFSLDSALLVSCSSYDDGTRKQRNLKIWDAVMGIPISTILGDTFAVANDFSTIASSQDNIATLYVNGNPGGTLLTTPSKIQNLALSSESRRVAAALVDKTVWLWDSGNAELIDSFKGDGSRLQFSPTGTRLAYASANGIVKLRDAINGRSIADLQCDKIQFSADSPRIASLSHAGELTLRDSESGELIAAVNVNNTILQYGLRVSLAISANGSFLATAEHYEVVTLWSESLTQIKVLSNIRGTNSMAFSLDNILAIAAEDTIKLYDVNTDSFIYTLPYNKMALALAFSPDSTHLAVLECYGNVNLCDIRGIDVSGHPPKEKPTAVTALALSRDCSRLACASGDGTVELWGTSPTMRRIAAHKDRERIQALVFGPDGGLFASRSGDETIELWNGNDGSLRGTLKVPRSQLMALSNSMLVAAAWDGDVTLWSLGTLSLIHTFKKSSYATRTVSIAENNALIAVAHLHGVSLLDAENHRTVTTFDVRDGIHTMAFIPNNSQLVAQSTDGVFLSFNLVNKHVMKGATFEHLTQLPNISLWHGVPVWYCRDKEQHYLAALFPQHKSPVPVLWIPGEVFVTAWTQGSSMIALHCEDGRIILLRLPSSHLS